LNRDVLTFTGLIVQEGKGFWALCPELDVASEGRSVAKAKAMLQEAVTGYLESCFESNLPYLRPVSKKDDPRQNQSENIAKTFRIRVDLAVKVHV